ncbi:hypothetical protein [Herpetosiphon llansteffanensis]|uniref:hypothetical protein n=1 Tax=Herpetosiphon llansteffanensis TaxID=2094568 RepID=UPI0013DEF7FF|nr:hypothetical protein [Herpetosiphon llansteffanensis]
MALLGVLHGSRLAGAWHSEVNRLASNTEADAFSSNNPPQTPTPAQAKIGRASVGNFIV